MLELPVEAYCITTNVRSNKRVGLSFKWHGSYSLGVMRYGCYANGFRFNSHLADFCFFFFTFFQTYVLPLRASVRIRLGLSLSFMLSSFLPSLLHSCCALLLCHRWRMNKFSNFKIHRRIYSHCLILIASYNNCNHVVYCGSVRKTDS